MTNGRVDVEEERRVQEKRVQIKLALGEKKREWKRWSRIQEK